MRKNLQFARALTGWLGSLLLGTGAACAQGWDQDLSHLFNLGKSDQSQWTRHFRLSAVMGLNFRGKVETAGTFAFSGNHPGAAGVSGQDHFYDDGYVRVDATGNKNGQTWYWGYQGGSTQYVPGDDRIYFHAAESYTVSGSAEPGSGAEAGFELAYGGKVRQGERSSLGWEFGFGFMPIGIKDQRTLGGVSATRITHSYPTAGIVVPAGPYQGTYSGPGALLNDVAQNETIGAGTVTGLNLVGTRELEATLYSLRLGPTWQWDPHPRISTLLGAGAALGIVSGDLKMFESVQFPDGTMGVNAGRHSGTELTYGGYLSAALLLHTVENGDLYLGVQYLPMSSATFRAAGRRAQLDQVQAVYFSIGIHWPF